MKHKRHFIFAAVVLAGLVLDLATKSWAWSAVGEPSPLAFEDHSSKPDGRFIIRYHSLPEEDKKIIGKGTLKLVTTYNPGAFAGMMSEQPWILLLVTFLMIPVVVLFYVNSKSRFEQIAVAAILAGTLGNLYDRAFVHPAPSTEAAVIALLKIKSSIAPEADLERARRTMVRDFLHVDLGFWPLHPWPTFNIADMLLSCGVIALMGYILIMGKREDSAKTESAKGTSP